MRTAGRTRAKPTAGTAGDEAHIVARPQSRHDRHVWFPQTLCFAAPFGPAFERGIIMWTACIWRGDELSAIKDFDNLVDAVRWVRKQLTADTRAGYVNTSGNIAPKECEQ